MELIYLFIILPILFGLHFFLFTKTTKLFLQKTLGVWFINHCYRALYAIFSVLLLIYFIKIISSFPAIPLLSLQDSLSNIVFLILDTFRLIFLFLIVESIWTLGMTNVFGIKHLFNLFSKKKLPFHLDFIVSPFKVKGLYLRHQHPLLFYLILFILLDRTLTLQNIFSVIFLSTYYILFVKMLEDQLREVFPLDYEKYRSKTKFFLIMLKKYQNEPLKK